MTRVGTAWLAGAMLLLPVAPAAAARDERAHAAAQHVLNDPSLQSSWPGAPPASAEGGSAAAHDRDPWHRSPGSRDAVVPGEAASDWHIDAGAGLKAAMRFLLWLLAMAAAVALFVWLGRSRGARADVRVDAAPAAAEPAPPPAAPDEDPAALAALGRYGDAAHALLLTTLADLGRLQRTPLPASLTAREAAQALALSPPLARSLHVLVGAVESGRWGGQAVGRETWELCLHAADALRSGGVSA